MVVRLTAALDGLPTAWPTGRTAGRRLGRLADCMPDRLSGLARHVHCPCQVVSGESHFQIANQTGGPDYQIDLTATGELGLADRIALAV